MLHLHLWHQGPPAAPESHVSSGEWQRLKPSARPYVLDGRKTWYSQGCQVSKPYLPCLLQAQSVIGHGQEIRHGMKAKYYEHLLDGNYELAQAVAVEKASSARAIEEGPIDVGPANVLALEADSSGLFDSLLSSAPNAELPPPPGTPVPKPKGSRPRSRKRKRESPDSDKSESKSEDSFDGLWDMLFETEDDDVDEQGHVDEQVEDQAPPTSPAEATPAFSAEDGASPAPAAPCKAGTDSGLARAMHQQTRGQKHMGLERNETLTIATWPPSSASNLQHHT